MLKDLQAYYLKPPNISWGILFPFAFVLAFVIRDPGNLESMVPGLLALTLLFGTSSMEAIVITFERRIGALWAIPPTLFHGLERPSVDRPAHHRVAIAYLDRHESACVVHGP
jgi:hypothetical protein